MTIYILTIEYRGLNEYCFNNRYVSDDISFMCDSLIKHLIADNDTLEKTIKEACVFQEPKYEIDCSLEDYHLQTCLRNIFFKKGGVDGEFTIQIEKRELSNKESESSSYDVYALFYSFIRKRFVIGLTDIYPSYIKKLGNFEPELVEDDTSILFSPSLDNLNSLFSHYFQESFNLLDKR